MNEKTSLSGVIIILVAMLTLAGSYYIIPSYESALERFIGDPELTQVLLHNSKSMVAKGDAHYLVGPDWIIVVDEDMVGLAIIDWDVTDPSVYCEYVGYSPVAYYATYMQEKSESNLKKALLLELIILREVERGKQCTEKS